MVFACLIGSACREGPDQGTAPRTASISETSADDDSGAPLRLSYVCGNRFVLVSSYTVPVTLTWRVSETSEEGSVTLPGASAERHPTSSEQLVETRNRGTLELYLEGRRIKARANGAIPCTPSIPAPSFAGASVAEMGQWGPVLSWPIVAVHANLLPNGKVLLWGSAGSGVPHVWDPATSVFTPYPSPALLFCAGHAFAQNGALVVVGGHIRGDHGIPNITLFNTSTGWTSSRPMPRGRWYPTATTMGSGEVAVLAGADEQAVHVTVPEVWTPTGLRRLSTASLELPYYPASFLAPNGKLFVAGEQQMSRYLDITGTGRWTSLGLRRFGTRDQGAAVMYDKGRILYAGGGRTTNTAEVINLNGATPNWEWTQSMAYARRHHNLTILPTGEVLVTGGTAGTEFNDLTQMVRAAEVWNPATGHWSTLASSSVDRAYHSIALLLPDGRVLQAGGGAAGSVAINQFNAQIFSPPYLLRGPRPVIASAPGSIAYGATFRVPTPEAAGISRVSLVRIGSTTHGIDMNQRFQRLSFIREAGALTVTAPTSRNITPPGHYLLFILNADGVPSVAKIVKVGSVSEPPPPPPPPPPGTSITLGVTGYSDAVKQYVTLKWTGASGTMVAVYRNGSVIKSVSNTGRYTNSITFIGPATYRYKVCESGSTRCSSEAAIQFSGRTAPPMPLAVAAWTEPTRQLMDLRWAEVSGTTVDVHRNGRFLKNTPNTGRYTNSNGSLVAATYAYKVCEAGTTRCSGVATVQFR